MRANFEQENHSPSIWLCAMVKTGVVGHSGVGGFNNKRSLKTPQKHSVNIPQLMDCNPNGTEPQPEDD